MDATVYNHLITSPFNVLGAAINTFVSTSYLENHDILKGYICANIDHTGSFEVPMAILPFLEIISAQSNIKWEQIAMPLYYGDIVTRSTSDAIIKYFFQETPVGDKRLSKVITKTGKIYYGGKGMIFDHHMEPLVLYTATIEDMSYIDSVSRPRRSRSVISALNVRVSPQVLLKDDILKKSIISKVIPSLVSKSFTSMRGPILDKPITPKVIIEDLSEWIKRPAKVGSPQTFEEDMQKFLSREDIIQDIIDCV